jgi:hypothetical protein
MSEQIVVTELGAREFAVRITEGADTTEHRVVVPAALLEELLLDEDDAGHLVHEAVAFLLEHTTADAVPEDLTLGEVVEEHEEFVEEMRRRLE